jgi:uncharacterized protein YcnI
MRTPRVAALTAALLVLPVTAAWAHPSLDPNQVPVGEPVEATLVVPHGCSTGEGVVPEDGEAVPTTRFDLQLVEGVTVEPGDVDGWDVEDDGEAIVWTDAGGATSDPIELPVTITVEDGTAGDELAIAAYQECEDGSSYRWTEGSDSTPAVALQLTEGETGTTEVDMEGMDHGSDGTDDPATGSGSDTSSESGTAVSASDDPGDQTTGEVDSQALAAEDGGSNTGLVVGLVVAALALLAVIGLVVRRRSA